jgi:ABC-type Mn2+/Zn2+ transport system permease subunit
MSAIWHWLFDPLKYEFMRQALEMGILLGILCAIVGSYLIVQKMGMMTCVISHAILPGISISVFLGISLSIGAFIFGILSALFVVGIQSRSRIKTDTAMTLTLSSFLGFGVLLISVLKTDRIDLTHILFGDILGVRSENIWMTLALVAIVLILTKLFYKELQFYTFDPLGAKACGLPVSMMYCGLVCVTTLTIIASMQAVGVLLVMALLVGPPTIAYLLVKELHEMMGLGTLIGSFSAILGIYLSYPLQLPSGPTIVMVIFIFFIIALLLSPTQGILTEVRVKRKNLSRSIEN